MKNCFLVCSTRVLDCEVIAQNFKLIYHFVLKILMQICRKEKKNIVLGPWDIYSLVLQNEHAFVEICPLYQKL